MNKIDFFRHGVSPINKKEKNSEEIKFSLYPRKFDDAAYLSNLVIIKEAQMALFYGPTLVPRFIGLRVLDSTCFAKIVQIFDKLLRSETVFLQSPEIPSLSSLVCR